MYKKMTSAALALVMLCLLGAAVLPKAQPGPFPNGEQAIPSASTTPATSGEPLTAENVGPWLDGYMTSALARAGVAGAVVVLVKDGQILAQKGYGTSDVEKGIPVDPQRTLFRIGSIAKLFTWTAVMQLVERGQIDLDADINRYLDFKIPPRNGKPITMRNLMTHTPGFEEYIKGLITTGSKGGSLGATLKKWTPERVFDPGTTPAYSNYGVALAGYIVERVAGMPFETYAEQRIFLPLGMRNTTFRQPLPPKMAPFMSKGYPIIGKPAQPFEMVSLPPAGSVSSTGTDMARFMIAHLQKGRLGDVQILRGETARMMHDTPLALMKPLNGIRLGFFDQNLNGRRIIGHGGDTTVFHSNLMLFLDENVGLFFSMNTSGVPGAGVRQALLESFADRYFPAPVSDARVDDKMARTHANMIAGDYISARASFSSFMAAPALLGGGIKIIANEDGSISLPLLVQQSGEPKRYREVAPFLWREVGGHDRIGAKVENGKVVRISSDLFSGIMVFDRAPAWMSVIGPAVMAAVALLLLTVIVWPVTALVRRRYKAPFPYEGEAKRAYLAVRIAALVALATCAAWMWFMQIASQFGGSADALNLDAIIFGLEALTLVAFVGGSMVAVYNLVTVWRARNGWLAILASILILLAFLSLLWFAVGGNLINFSLQF